MEGDQGGRLAAHFCINLQIDSIRKRETGEGGQQAVKDDKAPRAGHSTLSKPFRPWLLDEWSALLASIPYARTWFGFTGAYSALRLTSPLSSSLTCREMDRTSQTSHRKRQQRSEVSTMPWSTAAGWMQGLNGNCKKKKYWICCSICKEQQSTSFKSLIFDLNQKKNCLSCIEHTCCIQHLSVC